MGMNAILDDTPTNSVSKFFKSNLHLSSKEKRVRNLQPVRHLGNVRQANFITELEAVLLVVLGLFKFFSH